MTKARAPRHRSLQSIHQSSYPNNQQRKKMDEEVLFKPATTQLTVISAIRTKFHPGAMTAAVKIQKNRSKTTPSGTKCRILGSMLETMDDREGEPSDNRLERKACRGRRDPTTGYPMNVETYAQWNFKFCFNAIATRLST
ncbi:hypothetical protein HPP92_029172 [Vanilla planifolia]|uniref:Uncharacterized protein n=1 Tax=Vanilla planifolia TaxID=51239 RepID=A0A835P4N0_VANPL|nr:hypothetical protein HPP92_029172 [Vanilla planifolia]KAG0445785.1 hypothetical protein HPP92_029159 [Vanilla planifolia]